ncbi:MAG: LON peptidase substrate-binding domain-containing protein [Deltaproteobacteria bacterium]|nr:LON peptidase substrate-binding domain-containing protein [Deltaproteobacteria bacterium]
MNENRETLAIFPLPNVVLFPGIVVPLRIFEPRYLEMMADVLNGDGLLGIVTLKPGWEAEYENKPDVYEVGCKGLVVKCDQDEEDSLQVLVRGVGKFRIAGEIEGKSYRRAEVIPISESHVEELDTEGNQLRQELLSQLVDCGDRFIDIDQVSELSELDTNIFINAMSFVSPFDTSSKQFLLEAENVPERYRKYIQLAEFSLCDLRIQGSRVWSAECGLVH